MKDGKETREKLLESAKAEFSENGFMKASLRNICKNAGVTTGALYFFFQDKDDLFVSLVKEPIEQIKAIMYSHYEMENSEVEKGSLLTHDSWDDLETVTQIIHQVFEYKEEILLLLTKAQGSSMEYVLDEFVEVGEKHYRKMSDAMSRQTGRPLLEDNMIHWFAHMQVDLFVYMITHIETEQEAVRYIEHAMRYMINGWYGMFGIYKDVTWKAEK